MLVAIFTIIGVVLCLFAAAAGAILLARIAAGPPDLQLPDAGSSYRSSQEVDALVNAQLKWWEAHLSALAVMAQGCLITGLIVLGIAYWMSK